MDYQSLTQSDYIGFRFTLFYPPGDTERQARPALAAVPKGTNPIC